VILTSSFRESNPRLPVIGFIVLGGLLLLLLALFRVQVVHAGLYGEREESQSLRRIRIPSARGEIVDRHGVILAGNRPSYDVVIQLDRLRVTKRQNIVTVASSNLAVLAQTLNRPITLSEQEIRNHYTRRRPLPLPVWRDLNAPTIAAFQERASHLPAFDLIPFPVRQYPHGALAAHVLGFVGQAELPEEEVDEFAYALPETAGRQGVERAIDEALRGAPGTRAIRVNPAGQTVGHVATADAQRGDRVTLTLDARLQQIVEDALDHASLPAGKELRAAVVALDPRTGEVLALASRPTFDPNIFTPGTTDATVNAVLQNPGSPLLNRATGSRYAPGSTFKTVTLLAALANGVNAGDVADCAGSYTVGNRSFGCWNRRGHGRVDAAAALRLSCDVWFYQKGLATKPEMIAKWATEFGLGEKTGFDLGGEVAGLVPTPGWKRLRLNERWWDGDTAQLAIGQSFLLTTPLQMANVAATLANGGTVWRPYLVRQVVTPDGQLVDETQPEARHRLRVDPRHMEFVRQAMLAAVQQPDGTGHRAAVKGITVAGKTGTAEADVQGRRINRVWFIGFAPYEAPQLAVAVMFEDADSGGHTAAPVAGKIFAGWFEKSAETVGGGATYAD
jgi:penicillin-binding protein 2